MSLARLNQVTDAEDAAWKNLYRIGGAAALIATVLFLSDVIVLTTGGSMLSAASDWFALMQSDRVAGLLQLFFTDLIGVALVFPIVFALYAALRRTNRVYSAFATGLACLGIAIIIATNTNYSLVYLSDQYAAAATDAQRSILLAEGESMLAILNGTGPIMAGFFLEGALVIISVVMLQDRTRVFSKGIAYLGILGHGLDLVHSIVSLTFIPVFNSDLALAIGVPLLAIGGTFQLIWYPLVGRRLLQLGRQESKALPELSQA